MFLRFSVLKNAEIVWKHNFWNIIKVCSKHTFIVLEHSSGIPWNHQIVPKTVDEPVFSVSFSPHRSFTSANFWSIITSVLQAASENFPKPASLTFSTNLKKLSCCMFYVYFWIKLKFTYLLTVHLSLVSAYVWFGLLY